MKSLDEETPSQERASSGALGLPCWCFQPLLLFVHVPVPHFTAGAPTWGGNSWTSATAGSTLLPSRTLSPRAETCHPCRTDAKASVAIFASPPASCLAVLQAECPASCLRWLPGQLWWALTTVLRLRSEAGRAVGDARARGLPAVS